MISYLYERMFIYGFDNIALLSHPLQHIYFSGQAFGILRYRSPNRNRVVY